ncbi:hydroxyproline O-arabinosyltransferase 1-like [Setaria italica]|uniref:hydroxyproline O-arabinosyltransferase 1-like n=1 Tax=Setaria italica TaxID=4555 RepID=UPI000350BE6A|nr:hydroxyproline O-arabinosyltransferase 1-like [Setaria italica]
MHHMQGNLLIIAFFIILRLNQGYIVLNRPWAFVQWLQKADIKEEYILMAEPDHIIVKPIPNLSRDGRAAAFPFLYIELEKNEKVLRKFFPVDEGPMNKIDPIGNSPVIIEKESLARMAPTWVNVSIVMKKDPDADKTFGWVFEM